jgi:YHS domain-containing protein
MKIQFMKIQIISSLVMASLVLFSCGTSNDKANAGSAGTNQVAIMDTTNEKTYAVSLVNNKKDPTCGMPVTAGISDTAHYEKNVLGFCSTECKNEFLKNPKANLAAAEIK